MPNETANKIKKAIFGHENVELADVLQIVLFVVMAALLLFIALKTKRII